MRRCPRGLYFSERPDAPRNVIRGFQVVEAIEKGMFNQTRLWGLTAPAAAATRIVGYSRSSYVRTVRTLLAVAEPNHSGACGLRTSRTSRHEGSERSLLPSATAQRRCDRSAPERERKRHIKALPKLSYNFSPATSLRGAGRPWLAAQRRMLDGGWAAQATVTASHRCSASARFAASTSALQTEEGHAVLQGF